MADKTAIQLHEQPADSGETTRFNIAGDFQERFMRRREVCQLTTIPSSTLTDYIKAGIFPKPYKLNARKSSKHGSAVWKWSEVLGWMNSRQPAG